MSALIGLSVFLSLSSGALLSIIFQVGLISWAWAMRPVKHKWLILFALFAVAYVVIDIMSTRSPIRVFMTYATFSPHNAYWRATIFEWGMQNVWNNPIVGLGRNDWVRPAWMHSASVDNFWLLVAMRYGIPGFVFLAVGCLISLLQVGWRDFGQNVKLQQFRHAWIFTFIGLTFSLATVHVWASAYSFIFFLFGAGLWLITAKFDYPATENTPVPDPSMSPQYRRAEPAPGLSRAQATERSTSSAGLTRQSKPTRAESLGPTADRPRYSRFSGGSKETDEPD
jgi:hypothetical protein